MSDEATEPPATRSRTHLAASTSRHQSQLQARRSPSPSSTDRFFPPTAMATPATLSVEDIIKVATASAQAAAQALAAANRPAAAVDPSVKKVELPPFDRKNIHTWIRRVEAAFGRAGVTQPKDKFFFIEAKLDVNLNPKINEYMCGDSTAEKWDEFLQYLQDEYGRSREQQASLFLAGISRDGLRPTQHLAKIKDLTKDITLDDLIKEMLLKDLPKSVRQTLAERPNLTSDETAKAADNYFDKEGRLKHETETTRINNVSATTIPKQQPNSINDEPPPRESDDENNLVNAISRNRFRRGYNDRARNHQPRPQQQQPQPQRGRTFTPAFTPAFTNSHQRPSNYKNTPQGQSRPTLKQICRNHLDYGEKAYSCEPGCQFKARNQTGEQSGNGTAGRRM